MIKTKLSKKISCYNLKITSAGSCKQSFYCLTSRTCFSSLLVKKMTWFFVNGDTFQQQFQFYFQLMTNLLWPLPDLTKSLGLGFFIHVYEWNMKMNCNAKICITYIQKFKTYHTVKDQKFIMNKRVCLWTADWENTSTHMY